MGHIAGINQQRPRHGEHEICRRHKAYVLHTYIPSSAPLEVKTNSIGRPCPIPRLPPRPHDLHRHRHHPPLPSPRWLLLILTTHPWHLSHIPLLPKLPSRLRPRAGGSRGHYSNRQYRRCSTIRSPRRILWHLYKPRRRLVSL